MAIQSYKPLESMAKEILGGVSATDVSNYKSGMPQVMAAPGEVAPAPEANLLFDFSHLQGQPPPAPEPSPLDIPADVSEEQRLRIIDTLTEPVGSEIEVPNEEFSWQPAQWVSKALNTVMVPFDWMNKNIDQPWAASLDYVFNNNFREKANAELDRQEVMNGREFNFFEKLGVVRDLYSDEEWGAGNVGKIVLEASNPIWWIPVVGWAGKIGGIGAKTTQFASKLVNRTLIKALGLTPDAATFKMDTAQLLSKVPVLGWVFSESKQSVVKNAGHRAITSLGQFGSVYESKNLSKANLFTDLLRGELQVKTRDIADPRHIPILDFMMQSGKNTTNPNLGLVKNALETAAEVTKLDPSSFDDAVNTVAGAVYRAMQLEKKVKPSGASFMDHAYGMWKSTVLATPWYVAQQYFEDTFRAVVMGVRPNYRGLEQTAAKLKNFGVMPTQIVDVAVDFTNRVTHGVTNSVELKSIIKAEINALETSLPTAANRKVVQAQIKELKKKLESIPKSASMFDDPSSPLQQSQIVSSSTTLGRLLGKVADKLTFGKISGIGAKVATAGDITRIAGNHADSAILLQIFDKYFMSELETLRLANPAGQARTMMLEKLNHTVDGMVASKRFSNTLGNEIKALASTAKTPDDFMRGMESIVADSISDVFKTTNPLPPQILAKYKVPLVKAMVEGVRPDDVLRAMKKELATHADDLKNTYREVAKQQLEILESGLSRDSRNLLDLWMPKATKWNEIDDLPDKFKRMLDNAYEDYEVTYRTLYAKSLLAAEQETRQMALRAGGKGRVTGVTIKQPMASEIKRLGEENAARYKEFTADRLAYTDATVKVKKSLSSGALTQEAYDAYRMLPDNAASYLLPKDVTQFSQDALWANYRMVQKARLVRHTDDIKSLIGAANKTLGEEFYIKAANDAVDEIGKNIRRVSGPEFIGRGKEPWSKSNKYWARQILGLLPEDVNVKWVRPSYGKGTVVNVNKDGSLGVYLDRAKLEGTKKDRAEVLADLVYEIGNLPSSKPKMTWGPDIPPTPEEVTRVELFKTAQGEKTLAKELDINIYGFNNVTPEERFNALHTIEFNKENLGVKHVFFGHGTGDAENWTVLGGKDNIFDLVAERVPKGEEALVFSCNTSKKRIFGNEGVIVKSGEKSGREVDLRRYVEATSAEPKNYNTLLEKWEDELNAASQFANSNYKLKTLVKTYFTDPYKIIKEDPKVADWLRQKFGGGSFGRVEPTVADKMDDVEAAAKQFHKAFEANQLFNEADVGNIIKAQQLAENMAYGAMGNYGVTNNVDEIIRRIFPFFYFPTRSVPFYVRTGIQQPMLPWVLADQQRRSRAENVPDSLLGYTELGKGSGIFVNPLKPFMGYQLFGAEPMAGVGQPPVESTITALGMMGLGVNPAIGFGIEAVNKLLEVTESGIELTRGEPRPLFPQVTWAKNAIAAATGKYVPDLYSEVMLGSTPDWVQRNLQKELAALGYNEDTNPPDDEARAKAVRNIGLKGLITIVAPIYKHRYPEELRMIEDKNEALLEVGVTDEQIKSAKEAGFSPFMYLNERQRKAIYDAHPDWGQWMGLIPPSMSPKERVYWQETQTFYDTWNKTVDQLAAEQVEDTRLLKAGEISASDWRRNYQERSSKKAEYWEFLEMSLPNALVNDDRKKQYRKETKKYVPPTHPEDLAVQAYYDIIPEVDEVTRQVDYDTQMVKQEAYLEQLRRHDPALYQYLMNTVLEPRLVEDDVEIEYRMAKRLMREYFLVKPMMAMKIPEYKQLQQRIKMARATDPKAAERLAKDPVLVNLTKEAEAKRQELRKGDALLEYYLLKYGYLTKITNQKVYDYILDPERAAEELKKLYSK